MERRVTSHTEEEEMNQRRRLLTLARKGDQKAVDQLFELYQVRVFSGDSLKKKKLPSFPLVKTQNVVPKGSYAPEKKEEKPTSKISAVMEKKHKVPQKKGSVSTKTPTGRKPSKETKTTARGEQQPRAKKVVGSKTSSGKSGTPPKAKKLTREQVKPQAKASLKGKKRPPAKKK